MIEIDEHEACRSLRLAPADGGGHGVTLIHPFDRIDVLPAVNMPKCASRRRVARACAAAVRSSYEAGTTRTLVDARVRLLPYQLEPALAVVRGQATRVLLADEVGLGKTIQAGLILSELRARQRLRRALILTPAGLREQWASELRERFGLDATVLDAGTLGALQRSLPPWVNPWVMPGITLASIDLLKRDELLPQLEHVIWDAVVVDEAHHATRGTDRHQLSALVSSRARVVVLITATPHSGDRAAFENLCGLGALCSRLELPVRVFRRSRADVGGAAATGRTRLITVHRTEDEQRLDVMLRSYTERVWREAGPDARLAMIVLRKRALSGPASLARSLTRRIDGLDGIESGGHDETQLLLDLPDTIGGELIDDDREPAEELAAAGLADTRTERQVLLGLLEAANRAQRHDSKAHRLVSAMGRAREPVIVFTEYRDTLEDLRQRLSGGATLTVLHGAMLSAERQRAIEQFESGEAVVLLATDAAAEGLNLQRRCRWIIHYEVPWSPVRIEQRNGRVDRIGQSRRVHVWHLVARGTEEEGVLARVAARSSIAARDLGDEQAVAATVFGERLLNVPARSRARRPVTRDAVAEAERVATLRRIPDGFHPSSRPQCTRGVHSSPTRDSRLRTSRTSHVLAVVRAAVLDPDARLVASASVAVRARSLASCERAAAHVLGRTARRSIAIHTALAEAIQRREEAIQLAVARSKETPLQPSLFDRRLFVDAEHRGRALDAAMAELRQHTAARPYRVGISLIGALEG